MAYAGSLDPTFNGTGYVVTNVVAGSDSGLSKVDDLSVESDNSILIAGPLGSTLGLIQLTPSGQVDTTFGTGGTATLALPSGDTFYGLTQMLLGSNGQIILVGSLETASSTFESFLARLNSDGSADSSFGTDGLSILTAGNFSGATGAAIESNGQIVLVGTITVPEGTRNTEITLTRLNTDGSVDTSFGTDGDTTISSFTPIELADQFNSGDAAGSLAIEPNGQIIVVGDSYMPPNATQAPEIETPEIHRLDADGTLDDSGLTQSGILASMISTPSANGLIIEPNGQFLIYGMNITPYDQIPTVGLLNSDGSFVAQIAAPASPSSGTGDSPFALLPDGDIVVTGTGSVQTVTGYSSSFETERLNPDLTPDDTFGHAGISNVVIAGPTIVPFQSNESDPGGDLVAVGPQGQIILAGGTTPTSGLAGEVIGDYAVVQLTTTGSAHPGDYTGDGIADPAVYIPLQGVYAIRPSDGSSDDIIPFGISGVGQSIPAPGDYFGTGVDDLAVYLPSLGAFGIRNPDGGPDEILSFGISGMGQSIPAPGDYFGTGQTDLAVYLPSIGAFAIRNPAGGPDEIIPFGIPGAGNSIPVPGDYDGSGKTELAVYLPSLGAFAYRPADGGPDQIIQFGSPGAGNSIPVPGDYDQSGLTELAVYLPSLGEFIYRPAFGGAPDQAVQFGIPGVGQSIPVPADYTGSGQDEFAVYLPTTGVFAYRPEEPDTLEKTSTTGPPLTSGADVLEQFGVPGAGQTVPATILPQPDFLDDSTVSELALYVPDSDVQADPIDFLTVTATKKKTTSP
jgi:uncharacterized delta-60 repeat protein